MTLVVRKLFQMREALFPLVRQNIPRPTRQGFQTLTTIRLQSILSCSLSGDPCAKPITTAGSMVSSHSAMTLVVRKLFQMREALFPLVRQNIPRPTRQGFQTLPTIRLQSILSCSLSGDPCAKPITTGGSMVSSHSAMTLVVRKLFQMREALFPLVRQNIPRPTRQGFQTLPTIRLQSILSCSLSGDPCAKPITTGGSMVSSHSAMTL